MVVKRRQAISGQAVVHIVQLERLAIVFVQKQVFAGVSIARVGRAEYGTDIGMVVEQQVVFQAQHTEF